MTKAVFRATVDYGKRSLRSVETDNTKAITKGEKEERGFNMELLDDAVTLKSAAQLRQIAVRESNTEFANNLVNSKSFRQRLFPVWQQGGQSTDDILEYWNRLE
ncbi:unnamed protein product [Phytophthora lilii]|uniref:Unnamed protein product n=1 Tax=Phytophthora lilii TaxID=2077276 RepID=A0A9W6WRR7_9STRA|nr:unnamed protein product [Phytophthora lilii]